MPREVTVNIPHSLGEEEARRRVEAGFGALRRHVTGGVLGVVKFQERWEGQRLHFEGGALGQSVRGQLDVHHDAMTIRVELPDMLAAIAERVSSALKREGQKLLERK
jgi:hypothetical protein